MGNVEGVCPRCKHESSDMIFSRSISWLVKPRENAKRPHSTSPPQPKGFLESSDCDICGLLSFRGNSARPRSMYDPDCSRSPRQRVPVVRQVSPRFAPVKGERCHYCVGLDAGVCSSTCGGGGEDTLLLPVGHGIVAPARLTIHLFQFSFAVYVHSSSDAHRLLAKWVA